MPGGTRPNVQARPNSGFHPKAEGPRPKEEGLRQRIEPLQQPAGQRVSAQPQTSTKTFQEKATGNIDGNPYELELERLLEKQKRQAEKMEKMGRCLECGKKLGVFAKLWGLKFCKEHGF
jgi:ribosomal protein S14